MAGFAPGGVAPEAKHETLAGQFQALDRNGSGLVRREEIENVLKAVSPPATFDLVKTLIDEAEKKCGQAGMVNYKELIGSICGVDIPVSTKTEGSGSSRKCCHILHFNDVYNLHPSYREDPIGGAARFMTVLKDLKDDLKAGGYTPIIIFSGDFVGPSLMSTITHGAHLVEAFNLIGVEYATFGNHELDYGYSSLVQRLAGKENDLGIEGVEQRDYPESSTTWMSSNMNEAGGDPMGGAKTKRKALVDVDGVKVGLIAVSEDWLSGCAMLKEGELVYVDFIEAARRYAKELRAEGAELVLAITHNRLENDRKLTDEVPEIDLLLGGHDHFYKRDRRRKIVKGGEEFRWLNHVWVDVYPDNKITYSVQRYDVDAEVPENPQMLSLMKTYDQICADKYEKVIATSKVPLIAKEEYFRWKEGALSNWVCDAVAEDYSEKAGLQQAQIVLLMGFTFSGNKQFLPGPFKLGDLFTVFPKETLIVVLELTGADIVKTLHRGCQMLPRECGPFHHCNDRFSYEIQVARRTEGESASRMENQIVNCMYEGVPLDLERHYTVAMTSTMAKGKFGFKWLREDAAKRIVSEEFAMQIQDLLKMWCGRHPDEPIDPKMGRITITDE